MKTKILLLALISLFLTSCVTQRKCSLKFPVQSFSDSIYIENVKEVPVYIEGDTVKMVVQIDCPDQDVISVENGKLKQQIKILNGKLISNTQIKPDTVFVHTKETITKTKEVKVLEPVKFIPKFFRFCTWGFILIILSVIIYFVVKWRFKILALIK